MARAASSEFHVAHRIATPRPLGCCSMNLGGECPLNTAARDIDGAVAPLPESVSISGSAGRVYDGLGRPVLSVQGDTPVRIDFRMGASRYAVRARFRVAVPVPGHSGSARTRRRPATSSQSNFALCAHHLTLGERAGDSAERTSLRRIAAPCHHYVFTSIFRGRTSRRLGMRTVRTPSLRVASILSASSSPLNAKVRRYRLERMSA